MAENRTKGKQYYGIWKHQRRKQFHLKYFSNVCKVISVKCANKVHTYFGMPFSQLHIFCTNTVFKQFFLSYSSTDMSITIHYVKFQICLKLHIMYGNSILLVVAEEFYGNSAQHFCNIP